MPPPSTPYLMKTDNTQVIKSWNDLFDIKDARIIPKGSYLYFPEEEADKIYFLIDGTVKVGTYGAEGRELIKAIYRKGDLVGEECIFEEHKRRNFACTITKVSIVTLEANTFLKKLSGNQHLYLKLIRTVGQRLIYSEQRLEALVFHTSRIRIIEYLYQTAVDQGERIGYEVVIRNFLTHQEIANLTTTSRQTVTTILNELRYANLIDFNRKRMLIRSMNRLKSLL